MTIAVYALCRGPQRKILLGKRFPGHYGTGAQNALCLSVRCIATSEPIASGRMSSQLDSRTTPSVLRPKAGLSYRLLFVTIAVPTNGSHLTLQKHKGKYSVHRNSEMIGRNSLIRRIWQRLRVTSNRLLTSK